MNRKTRNFSLAAAAVVIALAGFQLGRHSAAPAVDATAGSAAASADRKVLYWHDPMVPGQRFDKPGKSPFMEMQLVPVYADAAGAAGAADVGGVRISPGVQQNLGMRMATVRRAALPMSFDAVGTVQLDERLGVAVQSRVAGFVEQLAVRAPMQTVRQGQVLASLFAPDWLGPQAEWLALRQAQASPALVAAARERLRALSIPDALVRQSEDSGMAQARFTLTAPASGVIAELGVREGMAVTPGMTLFRIAGLARVWAVAELPEGQALRLVRGQPVQAVLQADPAQAFKGVLAEILPQVNAGSRTVQARFEVDNRAGRLIPGALLRLQVAGPSVARLLLPSEAVIRTGRHSLALVRRPDGSFERRELVVGVEIGDETEVTQGLAEGEQVVASGQFLIDSEARLRTVPDSLAAPAAMPASPALPASAPSPASPASAASAAAARPVVHVGQGRVDSVDAEAITIQHGPVASLQWPAMTMGFSRPASQAFADVKPGDAVRFEFRQGGAAGWTLVSVQRQGGRP